LFFNAVGCASIPFKQIDYVAIGNLSPLRLCQEFKASLAQELNVVNSIVFQYKWRSFSALGYTHLDLTDGSFQVSCMNPVGIKLFELTGNRKEIDSNFVLKELLQKGDLPKVVGEDIRRIYFDMLPGPDAQIERQKYKMIFTQPLGTGTLEYVFGGSQHRLTEKHYYEKKRKLWSVYYYEYLASKNGLYPSGLILKHHRFGYKLIIRLKEVLSI